MDKNRLKEIISKFGKSKIMVLGDVMLDKYIWCNVERISPEAPVPVCQVVKEGFRLGGAANTTLNIVKLGSDVFLGAITGEDSNRDDLIKIINEEEKISSVFSADKSRPTLQKTRIMSVNQQLLRIDREETHDISSEIEELIYLFVKDKISEVKLLVISDYHKGMMTKKLTADIISLAKKNGVIILVDPALGEWDKYKGADLIKPNKLEAEMVIGRKMSKDFSDLKDFLRNLSDRSGGNVVITLGKDGLAMLGKDGKVEIIETIKKEVFDVTGAGDTMTAGMAVALSAGSSIKESAIIGNICSSVVVTKLGTSTCSYEELNEALDKLS
ncbi:MAG: PfkB family carbohydrate kinase [bacterium]